MQKILASIYSPKAKFIMKVNFIGFLLLLCAQVLFASAGKGQDMARTEITLELHNAPLKTALNKIGNLSGYKMVFPTDVVEKYRSIDLPKETRSVEQTLSLVLKNTNLAFKQMSQSIVLFEKPKNEEQKSDTHPTAFDPALAMPVHDVFVHVTDTTGKPIDGVTVLVAGSQNGGQTDKNGNITLNSINDNATLFISYVGYMTQRINVENRNEIDVVLKMNINNLQDVAVELNTGYQQIPKDRATGNFSFVNNQLFNRRVSPDVLSRLEGVVPGLIFNKNTEAGSLGYDINIQGHSTLFSNDQPLIVVDNFPYEGSLQNLNPNDVESITVLKDAVAASIWGVRSGNGVIVITTKKGKKNQKLQVEANANVTVSSHPNLFYSKGFLDANDYINITDSLFKLGYYNAYLAPQYSYWLLNPAVEILNDARQGKISEQDATDQLNTLRKYDVRNDLSKYFFQKSVMQQYAVNFRGGGENSDYYLSFGYDKDLANQVGNKNNRVTIDSKYNLSPVKNLRISVGLNYVQSFAQNNSNLPNTAYLYPYARLADANGNPLAISTDYSESWKDSLTNNLGYLNWEYKPLAEIGLADNTAKTSDNKINADVSYEFIKGLNVDVFYQYERQTISERDYNSDSTYSTRALINEYSERNATTGYFTYPIPLGGILNLSNNYITSKDARGQLNFNHIWQGHLKHEITALAGAEVKQAITESNSNVSYGYDPNTETNITTIDFSDYFPVLPSRTARIPNGSGFYKGTNNFVSYYGNANYTLNDIYSISASGRIDHSNLFGVNTNQKAVPLYSVGVAWNVSREKWYHVNWLPYLRPRISYGYTGNINLTATAVTTIQLASNSTYNGLNYAGIASPGNPDLMWEKIRKMNFGLDYAFLNNRIGGSFDFYFKKGINLFGQSPLAPSTGQTTFFGNTASTKGNGFDIVLNSINIHTRNFQWNTNLDISHVIDKVSAYYVQATPTSVLQNNASSTSSIAPVVGKPEFSVYSYKWAGLTHNTGDPQGYLNGVPSTDYASLLSIASVDSLQYNGPARPTYFGFFSNTFSYKHLSIAFNIIYKLDYYFRKQSISNANGIGLTGGLGNADYLKRWQQPGDELKTSVPSFEETIPFNTNRATFYQFSSATVDKGDNIRLEDINVAYDIDRSQIKKLPFSHIQIYGYVNNVGILWRANKDGIDSDVYVQNIYNFPSPRTYAIGVKVDF